MQQDGYKDYFFLISSACKRNVKNMVERSITIYVFKNLSPSYTRSTNVGTVIICKYISSI